MVNPNPLPVDRRKITGRPKLYPAEKMVIKSIYLPESIAEKWNKIGVKKLREMIEVAEV